MITAYKIHMSNDTKQCLMECSQAHHFSLTQRGQITVKVRISPQLMLLLQMFYSPDIVDPIQNKTVYYVNKSIYLQVYILAKWCRAGIPKCLNAVHIVLYHL